MQLQNGHLLPTGKGGRERRGSTQVRGNKHIFSPIHHVRAVPNLQNGKKYFVI